ncbi:protein kinase [Streptomyces sp. NPDC094049]|uniref:serine/threonine-protein kinase n=1 Tax=Streptomyces sp. NPDC094049 TaxID=3154987 RepID=UPI00332F94E0
MTGETEQSSRPDGLDGSGAIPLEPGDPRQIGAFRLLGVLGSGGMGRVYLGAVPGTFAAVKRVLPVLAEDPDFLSHFGHELDNLARLPAGANTKLLASDRTAKPPWFATEFIPGITLNEAVRLHRGPLPPDALWLLLHHAAAGLALVHGAQMVHRDLKPSNVMLTASGLSLIDFGVARAADQSRLTKTGMVIGTPAYMAPEQAVADRELTGAADVFGLGSLVLYAANGRPPFGDGSGPGLLYRVVHGEPDFGGLTEADPELTALVRTCFAKDPADRPTAAELAGLTAGRAEDAVWPAAVAERIARRAAFAAGAPTAEHLAELAAADPAEDIATLPLTPGGGKEPATVPPERAVVPPGPVSREKRRKRALLLIAPIVVTTGATLTMALGPYEIGRLGAAPGPSSAPPSTVASHPAGVPSSAGPGSPSGKTPGTGPSSSQPPGATSPGAPPPGDGGGVGGGGVGGGAVGGGGAGGTGPGGSGNGSGNGSVSGSGSGNAGGGGTRTTAPAGGGTTTRPAPRPTPTPTPRPTTPRPTQPGGGSTTPSGTYSLESASEGTCLAEYDQGFAVTVNDFECGSAPASGTVAYSWTYKGNGNGTFRLVNRRTGHCLQPSSGGPPGAGATACNGSGAQNWKVFATTSSGRALQNVGSGQCLAAGPPFVMSWDCDAGNSRMLWRNISAR